MKKDTLIEIILGTVGGLVSAIGMCMCLIEEWNMLSTGVIVGLIGILILACIYPVYRKNHPVEKKTPNYRLISVVIIGIVGALVMGFGMSLCLNNPDKSEMILGMTVGTVGLIVCVLNYPIHLYLKK